MEEGFSNRLFLLEQYLIQILRFAYFLVTYSKGGNSFHKPRLHCNVLGTARLIFWYGCRFFSARQGNSESVNGAGSALAVPRFLAVSSTTKYVGLGTPSSRAVPWKKSVCAVRISKLQQRHDQIETMQAQFKTTHSEKTT